MEKFISLKPLSASFISVVCLLVISCNPTASSISKISVSDEYIYFEAGQTDEPQTVTLTGVDADWSFTLNDEANSWLTVTKITSENTLTIWASFNTLKEEREGTITIHSGGDSKSINVLQGASLADSDIMVESFTQGFSCYFGDYSGLGIGLHSLAFATDGATFINPNDGFKIMNGVQLIIGLTTEFFKNGNNIRLSEGKYQISENNTVAGTIISGTESGGIANGTQVQIYKNGVIDEIRLVKDGFMEIKYTGDKCIFSFVFTLDNGKKFIADYKSNLKIYSLILSTLTKDTPLTGLTSGTIGFFGEDYKEGLNNWDIYLVSDNLTTNSAYGFKGSGDFICISLLMQKEITNGIPNGKYEIDFSDRPSSAIAGFMLQQYSQGCWYIKVSNNQPIAFAPIISGNVDIKSAGDKFEIKLNGYDDSGNSISTNFAGTMTYIDDTTKAYSQLRYTPASLRILSNRINPTSMTSAVAGIR